MSYPQKLRRLETGYYWTALEFYGRGCLSKLATVIFARTYKASRDACVTGVG
jgi:hypothetical protein